MPRFYLKTGDGMVSGPFTGLELREAALTQLVSAETKCAPAAEGPWKRLADFGLFTDQNMPIPHPQGSASPQFRVIGVNEALEGPFRLHELIDLAVRQILPRDASVQPVGRPERIPVNQFRVLDACLSGELSRDSTSVAPPVDPTNALPDEPAQPPGTAAAIADVMTDPQEDLALILSDVREQVQRDARERIANQSKTRFKINSAHACGLIAIVLAGVFAWWFLLPSSPRINLSDVIGNWVLIPSHETGNAFGISFKEDGTCVVFNSNGDCWSGEFEWFAAATGEGEAQSSTATRGTTSDIPSHNHRFEVQASDGYVRLKRGQSGKPPMLGDKSIQACFVRQDGDHLWIGYRTNDHRDASGDATPDVAWVSLWPRRGATEIGSLGMDMQGTTLLARYGVPEVARALDPAEVTANSDPNFAEPRSLVRYGATRLTLFADGSVRRFKSP